MLDSIEKHARESLLEVIRESIKVTVASTDEEAEFLIQDVEESLDAWLGSGANGFGQVYEREGRVVGFIVVKDYWNLSHLFVLPGLQRMGIGSALVGAAIETCENMSPRKKIQLYSSSVAAPFYLGCGFVQTGPGIERPGGCIPFEYRF